MNEANNSGCCVRRDKSGCVCRCCLLQTVWYEGGRVGSEECEVGGRGGREGERRCHRKAVLKREGPL